MIQTPGISVISTDASNIQAPPRLGIGLIQIPTKRGEHGVPKLITNELGYLRYFGGHHAIGESDLASYAILMARAGLPLYVSRIGHYTDPGDKTTLQGCKATAQQSGASATEAIFAVNQAGKKFEFTSLLLAVPYLFAGAKIEVSGSTGNDGIYTVVSFFSGIGSDYIEVCEAIPSAVADGDVTYYTENTVFSAGNVGAGYNGGTVTIQNAASGNVANCDIVISLPDSPDDSDYTYQDVPRNATNAQLQALTDNFQQCGPLLKIGALDLTNDVLVLSGGEEDLLLIVAADYAGDAGEGTGIYSFNEVTEGMRIVNFVPLAAVDSAYKAYAETRKDLYLELGTPVGANAGGIENYLDANPIDANYVSMNTCDQYIQDPRDTSKQLRIPGVLPAFMSKLKKDSTGRPWLSAGQQDYSESGLLFVKSGFDLGLPINQTDFTNLYAKGANVVTKQNGKYVYSGDRTTLLDLTKISRAETIGNLLVYINRELPKIVKPIHFQPNDPISWRAMYRLAAKWITDVLEAGRAIYPGENKNWVWEGDQNADDISDAVFNNQNDLSAGKYKVKFTFRPIAAMSVITLLVVATNQNITVTAE